MMSETAIIGITFAISYGFVFILLFIYAWHSDREDEKYWKKFYGKSDKKRKRKK